MSVFIGAPDPGVDGQSANTKEDRSKSQRLLHDAGFDLPGEGAREESGRTRPSLNAAAHRAPPIKKPAAGPSLWSDDEDEDPSQVTLHYKKLPVNKATPYGDLRPVSRPVWSAFSYDRVKPAAPAEHFGSDHDISTPVVTKQTRRAPSVQSLIDKVDREKIRSSLEEYEGSDLHLMVHHIQDGIIEAMRVVSSEPSEDPHIQFLMKVHSSIDQDYFRRLRNAAQSEMEAAFYAVVMDMKSRDKYEPASRYVDTEEGIPFDLRRQAKERMSTYPDGFVAALYVVMVPWLALGQTLDEKEREVDAFLAREVAELTTDVGLQTTKAGVDAVTCRSRYQELERWHDDFKTGALTGFQLLRIASERVAAPKETVTLPRKFDIQDRTSPQSRFSSGDASYFYRAMNVRWLFTCVPPRRVMLSADNQLPLFTSAYAALKRAKQTRLTRITKAKTARGGAEGAEEDVSDEARRVARSKSRFDEFMRSHDEDVEDAGDEEGDDTPPTEYLAKLDDFMEELGRYGYTPDGTKVSVEWGHAGWFSTQLNWWQAVAVHRCEEYRRLLASFAPGLGKTWVAIGVFARCCTHAGDVALVLCPGLITAQWKAEVERFWVGGGVVVLAGNERADDIATKLSDPATRWLIAPYRNVGMNKDGTPVAWHQDLCDAATGSRRVKLVVFDEAHTLRNTKTRKTSNLPYKKLCDHVANDRRGYRLLLTGTPVVSSPADMAALFDLMGERQVDWHMMSKRGKRLEVKYAIEVGNNVLPEFPKREPSVVYYTPDEQTCFACRHVLFKNKKGGGKRIFLAEMFPASVSLPWQGRDNFDDMRAFLEDDAKNFGSSIAVSAGEQTRRAIDASEVCDGGLHKGGRASPSLRPPTPGGGPRKWTASINLWFQMCMDAVYFRGKYLEARAWSKVIFCAADNALYFAVKLAASSPLSP